ncbi:MAG: DUF6062 family protein [Armatimonadota bacterium]|nr:DUF6062 family protein [Armatimonadota bacterium]MDR7509730.1 DUF6062 family protein [Armatimonadota bacterium]MDR7561070.1 DUF6062 family protein [Armatimonadota bacterium]
MPAHPTSSPEVPPDDITMVKVREALREGGCPVCRVSSASVRRYLWGFLYEQVNDPGVRDALLRSRGFCRHHAWMLTQFYDTLGVSIVYHHLVQELARDLRAVAEGVRRLRGSGPVPRLPSPTQPCPACRVARQAEHNALEAVVQRLDDEQVRARLGTDAPLCLPHLRAAWDLAPDARARQLLAALQVAALEVLGRQLEEFIRKQDYRFRHEGLSAGEGTAWTRAIEVLVGRDPLDDRRRAGSRGSG